MSRPSRLAKLAEYAAEDADVTFQLAAKLRPLLEESGQQNILHDIEGPLLPVLVRMEMEGIAARSRRAGDHRRRTANPDRRARPVDPPPRRPAVQPRLAQTTRRDPLRPPRAGRQGEENQDRPIQNRRTNARHPRRQTSHHRRHPGLARGHQTQVHLPRRPAEPPRGGNRPHPHPFPPTRRRHRPPRLVRPQPPEHPCAVGRRPQDPQGLRAAPKQLQPRRPSPCCPATTHRSSCASWRRWRTTPP